eukprot:1551660-Rhodomonas_salina.3
MRGAVSRTDTGLQQRESLSQSSEDQDSVEEEEEGKDDAEVLEADAAEKGVEGSLTDRSVYYAPTEGLYRDTLAQYQMLCVGSTVREVSTGCFCRVCEGQTQRNETQEATE